MPEKIEFPRQLRRAVEWTVNWRHRMRHRWKNRDRLEAWRGAVGSILKAHKNASARGLKSIAYVHNVSLYVLLLDQDLHWLASDMVNALDEERRQFVARQMVIQLCEGLEKMPVLLGKRYREGLRKLGMESLLPNINAIGKQLNGFKTRHADQLTRIRNIAGAHRDIDAAAQLTLMEAIKPLTILELAAEFSDSLKALVSHLVDLTLRLGGFPVMLRDYHDDD